MQTAIAMKHGDIISAWAGKVMFMLESELPGGFLKAMDFSTTTYLQSGTFAQDQMYHRSVCSPASKMEKEDYNRIIESSKYKKHLIEMELI